MSRTADGTTGDRPKTYTATGTYFYGTADFESGTEQNEYGAQRSVVSGTAKFRNYPSITANDRLRLVRDNLVFNIDGVRKDWENNQTICDISTVGV